MQEPLRTSPTLKQERRAPAALLPVGFRLAVAELRAQRILFRSRLVSVLVGAGLVLVLVGLGSRIYAFVQDGTESGVLNLAILSCGAAFVSFANATITGVENRASPQFTRAWVRRWPLPESHATAFIVLNQIGRGLALSITLFATIAIGASLAVGDPWLSVQALLAALLFPVPGVLLALLVSWREHNRAFGRVFIAILALLAIVIAYPLPLPGEPLAQIARVFAAPATLLLAQPPGPAVVPFLVVWVLAFAVSLVLALRAVRGEAALGSSRVLSWASRAFVRRRMPLAGLPTLRVSVTTALMGLCILVAVPLIVVSAVPVAVPAAGSASQAFSAAQLVVSFVVASTLCHFLVRGAFEPDDREQAYLARAPLSRQHADDVRLLFAGLHTVLFVCCSLLVLTLAGHAPAPFPLVQIAAVTATTVLGLEVAQRRRRVLGRVLVTLAVGLGQIVFAVVALVVSFGAVSPASGLVVTAIPLLAVVLALAIRRRTRFPAGPRTRASTPAPDREPRSEERPRG